MSSLRIRPVTSAIGAEISGVDLREPLSDADRDAIEQALFDHVVVFFRDQPIEDAAHVAFAARFGEVSIPAFMPGVGACPEVMVLDQNAPKGEGADAWHSDNTFMAEPPMGSILRAVRLPPVGGDTCFANMLAAYDALSEPMRRMIDDLEAVHDITKPFMKAAATGREVDLAELQRAWPPVKHPVVRTHPVSGRKALFVNANSTTHIDGLSERENAALLPLLVDHVRSPEFQCRFRWEVGSIAFWDNRSAQHYAVPDYHERRVMHRVTIGGDRPH